MAAFSQYWKKELNKESFRFGAPPCVPGEARLPVVSISLISSLEFTHELLLMRARLRSLHKSRTFFASMPG